MNNWTMAGIISAFDDALISSDCPADIDEWLDNACMDENVPTFVWNAVNALRKYDESLKQED